MRVQGGDGIGSGVPPAARRAAGSGFALPNPATSLPPSSATALSAAPAVGALLALQTVDRGGESRRRAIARGRNILDSMDLLKLGLLEGLLSGDALARLRTLLADNAPSTGDTVLDSLMAEVELRAAVELAKHEK